MPLLSLYRGLGRRHREEGMEQGEKGDPSNSLEQKEHFPTGCRHGSSKPKPGFYLTGKT